jgi:hypothetical protein
MTLLRLPVFGEARSTPIRYRRFGHRLAPRFPVDSVVPTVRAAYRSAKLKGFNNGTWNLLKSDVFRVTTVS